MALPSQNARPISRRAHMHRRRRGRHSRAIGLVVGAVVLLLAGWWVTTEMFGADEPGTGLVTGVGAVPEVGPGNDPIAAEREERAGTPGGPREPKKRAAPAGPPPGTRVETPPAREEAAAPSAPDDASTRSPQRTTKHTPVYTPSTPPAESRESRPRDPSTGAPSGAGAGSRTARRVAAGLDFLARDQPLQGRRVLTDALGAGDLGERDARLVRDRLTKLNQRLVFSPEVIDGDPFTLTYTIKSGDLLSRVPRKMGLLVDWRFIQHVNRIGDPKRVRVGQRLKLVTGPFHAVVDKSDYRLDLYLGDGPDRVYVRSFPVGLGEFNSTPEGRFRVREHSKLIDPEWINPRTRQRYAASDPANPIGEYWIGLDPDDERIEGVEGYGIHGTIEPDSIGRQASMGCVRMLPDDIRLIWGVMTEGISTVEIVR